MPDASVGSVSMKITASSKSASNAVSTLAGSLERLKAATEGVDVAGIASIGTAMQTLSASTAGVKTSGTALRSLARTVESLKTMDLGNLPASFEALSASVAGFSGFTGMLAQVKEFSKSITSLNSAFKRAGTMDVENLAPKLQEVASALRPLTDEMLRGGAGVANYGTQVKDLAAGLTQLTKSANAAGRSSTQLSGFQKAMNFAALTAKVLSTYYVIRRITSLLQSAFTNISSYIENMNLFAVAMGDAADEGKNLAEKMQSVLGVDPGEAERYMGVFNNLLTTFGNSSAAAKTMSENLTQLGYDLSSFYNISTSDAFEKLQSGITGQTKPLRELGIDISEARLQQELYALGIQATYANLSQADKAQLRYIAVMKQSSNALGDLGRTLDSPMNQMRVLEAQFTILGRAVGSVFIPALTRIIPVVTAVVEILAQGFSALASFFGFDLSKYVNVDTTKTISAGYEDVSDSLDDVGSSASGTAKDMKTLISGFDELNVLQKKSTSAGTSKGGAGNLLSGLNLPTYDMFQNAAKSKVVKLVDDMKKKLKSLYDTIVPFIPAIKGLAVEFAGLLILSKIVPLAAKFLEAFGITGSAAALFKYGAAIAVVAGEFTTFYSLAKAVASGTLDIRDAFVVGALAFTGFGIALNALIPGYGLAVAGITALIGVVVGLNAAWSEQMQESSATAFYDGVGVSITTLSEQYQKYIDTVTAGLKPVQDMMDEHTTAAQKISETNAEVVNLSTGVINGALNISDYADQIKEDLNSLYTDTHNNIELLGQTLQQSLTGTFAEVLQAAGVDLPQLSAIINQATTDWADAVDQSYADMIRALDAWKADPTDQELKAKYEKSFYAFEEAAGGATDSITDMSSDVSAALSSINYENVDSVNAAISGMADKTQSAKNDISQYYSDLQSKYSEMLSHMSPGTPEYQEVSTALSKLADAQKIDMGKIDQQYNDFADSIQENLVVKMRDQLDAAAENWSNMGWFQKMFRYGGDEAAYTQEFLNTYADKTIKPITDGLQQQYSTLGTNGQMWAQDAIKKITSAYIDPRGAQAGSTLRPAFITDFETATKNGLSEMSDNLRPQVDNVLSTLGKSLNTQSYDAGKNTTQGLSNGVKDSSANGNLMSAVGDVAKSVLSGLASGLDEHSPSKATYGYGVFFTQGLTNGISSVVQGAVSAVYSLSSSVKTAASNALAPTNSTQYGRNFGTGIATGISASASPTAAAVTNLADGARNTANSTLSSVNGQTSGSNFGYGIMNGINSRAWDVRSATSNMMSQVSSAVREAIRDMQDYANSNPVTITVNTRSTSSYGKSYKPHLADGGVAYGTSDVQIGEYQGAATNPEIVAPQSVMADTVQAANAPMTVAIVEAVMKVVDAVNAKDTTVVVGDDAIGTATTRYASRAKSRTGVNPITAV